MKLALNKVGRGRYEKIAGNIKVSVEKNCITNKWEGSVSEYSFTGKCIATGKDVKCYEDMFTWTSDTKREVSMVLVNFILSN